jgi:hypothetical protein
MSAHTARIFIPKRGIKYRGDQHLLNVLPRRAKNVAANFAESIEARAFSPMAPS